MDFIEKALSRYGATLQEGVILTNAGKITSVRAIVKRKRLRFESAQTKVLLFSGPATEEAVHAFVSKFWYWELR